MIRQAPLEQRSSNIAIYNLLYLFVKSIVRVFSKPLHCLTKRSMKDKGKLEQGNIGLHLLTGISTRPTDAPESIAANAYHSHNITADPLGILTEENRIRISQEWSGSGLYVSMLNHHQAEDQPVIS